jgi:excinuclease ABC subunit C
LTPDFEDSHSAIEYFLINELGDLGAKIHTGRSRNDQVLVALRLYAREALMELKNINIEITETFLKQADLNKNLVLPGYTQTHPLILDKYSPARYLLQKIRDEAHRFAITGHRAKKRKTLLTSDLESIEGIGPVKKKNLIRQFGGIQEVKRASVEDLVTINGINKSLAKRIYNFFNTG